MPDLRIKIYELPVRAAALNGTTLSAVFGGCSTGGEPCEQDSNCCGAVSWVRCLAGMCVEKARPRTEDTPNR